MPGSNTSQSSSPKFDPIEKTKYCLTARYNDFKVSLIHTEHAEHPAGMCATKARKLHALMYLVNGEGFGVFDGAAGEIKESAIWLMNDLAHEIMVLAELAEEAHNRKVAVGVSHG